MVLSVTLKKMESHDKQESCCLRMSAARLETLRTMIYGASVADALKYGNFNDQPIYEQLALPKEKRSITMKQMLQNESVEVWKKYQAKPDKVQY